MSCLNALGNKMQQIFFVASVLFPHYDLKAQKAPKSEEPCNMLVQAHPEPIEIAMQCKKEI